MNDHKKNHFIDLLRFLSALWVAFYHFNQPIIYIDNWYRNFLKLGHLGVPVFFVISGYCVVLSAHNSRDWLDFTIRRIFRIFPPYLISLVVVMIVVLSLKILTGYNSVAILPKNLPGILLTLTLLTSPFSHVQGINWVYWSLTCEILFYLMISISLLFPSKYRTLFLILISMLSLLLPVYAVGPLFFLKYWPTFALGIGIYMFQAERNRFLSLLFITINSLAMVKIFLLDNQTLYFFAAVISFLLISLSLKYKLRNNVFSKLGDYSYSVYLLHVPLGAYLMGHYKSLAIQHNLLLNIIFDIASYAVTLFIAYLAFKFVELPSIQIGKAFSQKINPKKVKLAGT